MQKTLVTFSLTIMFKVSVLFTFSRRWINSNLIWQEYEKKWKVLHVGFRKCSFNIYNRILLVQHVCIIDGTNLINSLPCKPTLNLLFLIVWLGSSCCYPFFNFFSPHFLCVAGIAHAQNFLEWDVFLIHVFLWQMQKLSNKSHLILWKKETFACDFQ